MNALNCPHCGQPAVSVSQKLFLGPAKVAACKSCGNNFGVPLVQSLLPLIPIIVWVIVRPRIDSSWLTIVLLVVASLISCVWYVKWVPLIRR